MQTYAKYIFSLNYYCLDGRWKSSIRWCVIVPEFKLLTLTSNSGVYYLGVKENLGHVAAR
jgi:hypothetical protein